MYQHWVEIVIVAPKQVLVDKRSGHRRVVERLKMFGHNKFVGGRN